MTIPYIAISIAILLIIGLLIFIFRKNKKQKPLSTLAALAFAFVIAGIVFGENRPIGYSLIGIGIILALIDIIKKNEKKKTKK